MADFDAATLDPTTGALRQEFRPGSSTGGPGDGLHPNRAGYQAIANAVDLSTLGTTLNGQRLPKGYEATDGTKRENGAETPLPSGSRIGLADTVFLEFEVVSRS